MVAACPVFAKAAAIGARDVVGTTLGMRRD
jgi:hypothetical protein